jgi:hypothetical protein
MQPPNKSPPRTKTNFFSPSEESFLLAPQQEILLYFPGISIACFPGWEDADY